MRAAVTSRGFFSLLFAGEIDRRDRRGGAARRADLLASQNPARDRRLGARVGRYVRWGQVRPALQAVMPPVAQQEMLLSGSATLNAQIWFSQFPLRPTSGWAVIAALLAVGSLTRPLALDWRDVALLLLLADPLWGSIWRMAAGRLEMLPLREPDARPQVWLPYLEPKSPAARLLGRDDHGVLHLVMRVVFPTVALALAVALVLGQQAVLLTLLVAGLSVGGWIARHSVQHVPAFFHSAVTVALPWLLALHQAGVTPAHERWPAYMALIALWFLHNWGEGRCLRRTGDRLGVGLLAVADVGMALLLIVARAPLWLALMSVLWLPTWLLVYQRRPLQRLNFWWLAAMLVSGVALGQSG